MRMDDEGLQRSHKKGAEMMDFTLKILGIILLVYGFYAKNGWSILFGAACLFG